jgi:hypothetical protein
VSYAAKLLFLGACVVQPGGHRVSVVLFNYKNRKEEEEKRREEKPKSRRGMSEIEDKKRTCRVLAICVSRMFQASVGFVYSYTKSKEFLTIQI